MFATLQEAFFRTKFPLAKVIYQSLWPTNAFFAMIRIRANGTSPFAYYRRKKNDEVRGNWLIPGQSLTADVNPKLVRIAMENRNIVSQQEIPDYFIANSANPNEVWGSQMEQAAIDVGRQIAKAAIVGRYIDTCGIVNGGSLTSATLLGAGVITPGPYNLPTFGNGYLKFNKAASTLQFKAPGDSEYGDAVAASGTVTLYSKNVAAYVTLTVNAVPATDAGCELVFSSTTQQPDGLDALIDPDQRIASGANGQSMTFTLLNRLRNKLAEPYRQDPLTCFVMHSSELLTLRDLSNALGGARIVDFDWPSLTQTQPANIPGTFLNRKIPTYMGHPILECDHIPSTAKGTAPITRSVYAVSMNPMMSDGQNIPVDAENPPGGFFGVAAGSVDGPMIQGPYGLGFYVKRITPDSRTTEAQRFGWYGNFGLGSSLAAAAADNVISS